MQMCSYRSDQTNNTFLIAHNSVLTSYYFTHEIVYVMNIHLAFYNVNTFAVFNIKTLYFSHNSHIEKVIIPFPSIFAFARHSTHALCLVKHTVM